MDTHTKRVGNVQSYGLFLSLAAFTFGSFIGFTFGRPPTVPRSCPSMHYGAHFLERGAPFETAASRAPSFQPLRGAATDTASRHVRRDVAVLDTTTESSSSAPPPADAADAPPASSSFSASSVSSAESASSSASSANAPDDAIETAFPAFDHAVFPVGRVPNWGAMKTPAEWDRNYDDMERSAFVRVPAYDIDVLATPMKTLLKTRDEPETVAILTAKLFYSTRFFGAYDLDAREFSGDHAGIDLKVPEGTPVVSIGGGRIAAVVRETSGLGLHVVVEHRVDGETYYAIYGHLRSVSVRTGQVVAPGDVIAHSGSTGRSTAAHLHLQIDRGTPGEESHEAYWPGTTPSKAEAAQNTVHPITFIATHARQ